MNNNSIIAGNCSGSCTGKICIAAYRFGCGILVYDPAQRGKGYGAEALALLEEYARTVLRLRQLWCNVLADNVPSLTLFERAGFRRVGVKKEWIRTPEGYKDEVLLQKLL